MQPGRVIGFCIKLNVMFVVPPLGGIVSSRLKPYYKRFVSMQNTSKPGASTIPIVPRLRGVANKMSEPKATMTPEVR